LERGAAIVNAAAFAPRLNANHGAACACRPWPQRAAGGQRVGDDFAEGDRLRDEIDPTIAAISTILIACSIALLVLTQSIQRKEKPAEP